MLNDQFWLNHYDYDQIRRRSSSFDIGDSTELSQMFRFSLG